MKKLFALILLLSVFPSWGAIKYYDDYPNNPNPPPAFIISLQTLDKSAGGIPYNFWTLDQMTSWLQDRGFTNGTLVVSNAYISIITNNTFINTNVAITFLETNNTFVNTNVLISTSNSFFNTTYVTNLYSTNITVETITNVTFVGGTIFTTNFYSTNITVDVITNNTFYSTNVVIQNITNQNFYTTNITVEQPGGFTNMNLTPLTVMFADANSAESSIPNAPGVLTNNGSGGVGFSQSLSLQELDAQNFYPTNMFTGLTNYSVLGTDGDGKLILGSGTVSNINVTTMYVSTNFSTNLYFVTGKGNTLIVTNIGIYGSVTNNNLAANQFLITDANKVTTNTLDGGSLINLTIRYDTNSIPSSGALTFGHAYFTNLQASVVLPAFTLGSAAYYESLVICVTNSGATTTTLTMPSGVKVAVANGGGNLIYCTNGTRTTVVVEHYGTVLTNAWKNDF